MIIFTLLGIFTAIFFFVVILMSIIEGGVRNKTNEKTLWKMDKVETANIRGQRDKVETRTGGLAHDRNRTYSEIQKKNDEKTQ
jgi:predicted membrane protein|tara:strand:+ start:1801 stop:2049 length:249 start_codon:yes stop_codon:yes gene_type:complete